MLIIVSTGRAHSLLVMCSQESIMIVKGLTDETPNPNRVQFQLWDGWEIYCVECILWKWVAQIFQSQLAIAAIFIVQVWRETDKTIKWVRDGWWPRSIVYGMFWFLRDGVTKSFFLHQTSVAELKALVIWVNRGM